MRASAPVEALILVVWALFACTVIANMWAFDKLVRRQYAAHRASWERDGRPHGFFFRPPQTRGSVGSWLAFQRCAHVWLFRTPHWMRRDREALRLMLRLRVSMLVSLAGLVGWIALVLWGVGALA